MIDIIVKQARVVKNRRGRYEYARLVIHNSKGLLKYIGKEATVLIIRDEGDGQ
jgi:hypothetical protein